MCFWGVSFLSYLKWWSWFCPWPAGCSCYTWKHKPLASAQCRWSPGSEHPPGSPAESKLRKQRKRIKKEKKKKKKVCLSEPEASLKIYSGHFGPFSVPLSTSFLPAPAQGGAYGLVWQMQQVWRRLKRRVLVQSALERPDSSGWGSCGSSGYRTHVLVLQGSGRDETCTVSLRERERYLIQSTSNLCDNKNK